MSRIYPRPISLAALVFLAVLVVVPQRASATGLVPFRARVTAETFTTVLCGSPPSLCVTTSGTGQATHLGKIRESASVVSFLSSPNSAGPNCVNEIRTTILTAANGDQITLEATGYNCLTGPTTVAALDTYTVTGGTGRFQGACGHGTMSGSVNRANSTAVVTFEGVLSAPGSLH